MNPDQLARRLREIADGNVVQVGNNSVSVEGQEVKDDRRASITRTILNRKVQADRSAGFPIKLLSVRRTETSILFYVTAIKLDGTCQFTSTPIYTFPAANNAAITMSQIDSTGEGIGDWVVGLSFTTGLFPDNDLFGASVSPSRTDEFSSIDDPAYALLLFANRSQTNKPSYRGYGFWSYLGIPERVKSFYGLGSGIPASYGWYQGQKLNVDDDEKFLVLPNIQVEKPESATDELTFYLSSNLFCTPKLDAALLLGATDDPSRPTRNYVIRRQGVSGHTIQDKGITESIYQVDPKEVTLSSELIDFYGGIASAPLQKFVFTEQGVRFTSEVSASTYWGDRLHCVYQQSIQLRQLPKDRSYHSFSPGRERITPEEYLQTDPKRRRLLIYTFARNNGNFVPVQRREVRVKLPIPDSHLRERQVIEAGFFQPELETIEASYYPG